MADPTTPPLPPALAALLDALLTAEVEYEHAAIEVQDADESTPEGRHVTMLRKVRDAARAALTAAIGDLVQDKARLDWLDEWATILTLTDDGVDELRYCDIDGNGYDLDIAEPRPVRPTIDAARTPTGGTPT